MPSKPLVEMGLMAPFVFHNRRPVLAPAAACKYRNPSYLRRPGRLNFATTKIDAVASGHWSVLCLNPENL